jgi:hypothetical protein
LGQTLWRHSQFADFIGGDGAAIEAIRKGLPEFGSVEGMGAKA